MQTFLPYPDFVASARALDDRRLGKQRVETLQVMRAINRPDYGWQNHPIVRMWRGYPEALARYGLDITEEWVARGHADTCELKILDELAAAGVSGRPRNQAQLASAGLLPTWLGDESLHRSHRSNLLRKDPDFYGPRFDEPDDLPYVWGDEVGAEA